MYNKAQKALETLDLDSVEKETKFRKATDKLESLENELERLR